jgi:hypothetical protein
VLQTVPHAAMRERGRERRGHDVKRRKGKEKRKGKGQGRKNRGKGNELSIFLEIVIHKLY